MTFFTPPYTITEDIRLIYHLCTQYMRWIRYTCFCCSSRLYLSFLLLSECWIDCPGIGCKTYDNFYTFAWRISLREWGIHVLYLTSHLGCPHLPFWPEFQAENVKYSIFLLVLSHWKIMCIIIFTKFITCIHNVMVPTLLKMYQWSASQQTRYKQCVKKKTNEKSPHKVPVP